MRWPTLIRPEAPLLFIISSFSTFFIFICLPSFVVCVCVPAPAQPPPPPHFLMAAAGGWPWWRRWWCHEWNTMKEDTFFSSLLLPLCPLSKGNLLLLENACSFALTRAPHIYSLMCFFIFYCALDFEWSADVSSSFTNLKMGGWRERLACGFASLWLASQRKARSSAKFFLFPHLCLCAEEIYAAAATIKQHSWRTGFFIVWCGIFCWRRNPSY